MVTQKVILLGGGGHAKVLLDALRLLPVDILGYTSPRQSADGRFEADISYLGTDEEIASRFDLNVKLVNAIGAAGLPDKRAEVYARFKQWGYSFLQVIHPSAVIGTGVRLGEGVQIMAGAVIQPDTTIGANALINTRASVDHDCQIGDHAHIAPGTTLCGAVSVGHTTHIGAGTTVIQGVHIGRRCLIGAGSLVIRDLADGKKAYGVPAKEVSW